MCPFFGLTPEYKLGLHEEIFSLCYYGKGGFTWEEVYNLPIYLRRFYIQQINKAIESKNKAESDASKDSKRNAPKFSKPPSYR
jgi:hypothetical protein